MRIECRALSTSKSLVLLKCLYFSPSSYGWTFQTFCSWKFDQTCRVSVNLRVKKPLCAIMYPVIKLSTQKQNKNQNEKYKSANFLNCGYQLKYPGVSFVWQQNVSYYCRVILFYLTSSRKCVGVSVSPSNGASVVSPTFNEFVGHDWKCRSAAAVDAVARLHTHMLQTFYYIFPK